MVPREWTWRTAPSLVQRMMADDLLRPAAGFLELLGCRAKRRDLAQFSCIVPSVGEILQFGVFRLIFFRCTYYARIAVDSPILRRIVMNERVFGENPKSAENAGDTLLLGNHLRSQSSPLHLPCTRLFWKRLPAIHTVPIGVLPHLAAATHRRSALTKKCLRCKQLPCGRCHHRGCNSTCMCSVLHQ